MSQRTTSDFKSGYTISVNHFSETHTKSAKLAQTSGLSSPTKDLTSMVFT